MDLSFLDREDVIKEFQDLVDPGSRRGGSEQEIPIDEDANIPVHKLNAMSLTITDVMQELERRGLQPKGFYSDDAKLLARDDKPYCSLLFTTTSTLTPPLLLLDLSLTGTRGLCKAKEGRVQRIQDVRDEGKGRETKKGSHRM